MLSTLLVAVYAPLPVSLAQFYCTFRHFPLRSYRAPLHPSRGWFARIARAGNIEKVRAFTSRTYSSFQGYRTFDNCESFTP